ADREGALALRLLLATFRGTGCRGGERATDRPARRSTRGRELVGRVHPYAHRARRRCGGPPGPAPPARSAAIFDPPLRRPRPLGLRSGAGRGRDPPAAQGGAGAPAAAPRPPTAGPPRAFHSAARQAGRGACRYGGGSAPAAERAVARGARPPGPGRAPPLADRSGVTSGGSGGPLYGGGAA